MTTKTIKTYKDTPMYVHIHKDRYNYIDEYYSTDVSTTYNITLQPYQGLTHDIINNRTDSDTPKSLSVKATSQALWNKVDYAGITTTIAPAGVTYLVQKRTYNNFSKRGTGATISEDGLMTNITNANNIYTRFYPSGTNWKIAVTVHTPVTSFTNQSYIYGNYSSNYYTPQICTDANGNLLLYLSGSGSGWNITNGTNVGTLTLDTTHDITLSYDGATYIVTVDGEQTWELASTTNVYRYNGLQFCIGFDSGNTAWTGSIDLSKTYIENNGTVYWRPYRDLGTLQKGCLESGLADTTEEKTYTAFVKPEGDLLLSESNADKNGYIWAGSLTVPAHTVTSDPYIAHFDLVGTNITIDNCIASGFNTSSWIVSDTVLTSSSYFATPAKRFITRFKPSDTNTNQCIWRLMQTKGGGVHTWIGIRYYDMCIWRSGFTYGNTDIFKNKEDRYYWAQVILDSTGVKVYVIENDAESFEELPTDLSQWQLNVQIATDVSSTVKYVEMGYADTSEYWRGTIDLLNTRIDEENLASSITGDTAWSVHWKPIIVT